MTALFERTYYIPSGELKVKLFYEKPEGMDEFNGGLVTLADYEIGYDDQDTLTFAPGSIKLGFTDHERKNYAVLKRAFDTTAGSLPLEADSWDEKHSAEVWLNGERILKGYMDKPTLIYNAANRRLEIDIVDNSVQLKNKTTGVLSTDDWFPPYFDIWGVYRNIYP